jgi:CreA protein
MLVCASRSAPARLAVGLRCSLLTCGLFCVLLTACGREEIGSVNTTFRITGSDKVVIEAYDDPKVGGVTCYVSRAKTGGFWSWFGLAEDASEAAIACRQVGEFHFSGPLPRQEVVFSERMSALFKNLHVVRSVDSKRNTLVYLTYSDRIISGSAKNSVTAVPVPSSLPIPVQK